jgi:hypothetical protein
VSLSCTTAPLLNSARHSNTRVSAGRGGCTRSRRAVQRQCTPLTGARASAHVFARRTPAPGGERADQAVGAEAAARASCSQLTRDDSCARSIKRRERRALWAARTSGCSTACARRTLDRAVAAEQALQQGCGDQFDAHVDRDACAARTPRRRGPSRYIPSRPAALAPEPVQARIMTPSQRHTRRSGPDV